MIVNISNKDKIFIALLFGALLFVFLPVIQSGFLQYDDVGRNLYAYYGWQGDGRALSDIIMKLSVGPGGLVNAGYFFQLLALICAAFSCYILMLGFKLKIEIASFIAIIILFCTPNILENISFVYDSFPMFLSVLLAVSAFYCCRQSGWKYIIAAYFGVFLSLNLYQVGINVFFVLCFMLLSYESLEKDKSRISFCKIGIISLFSLLSYKICISLFYKLGDYAGHKSNMSSLIDLMPNILNISKGFAYKIAILFGFNPAYFLCVSLIIIMPVFVIIFNAKRAARKVKSLFFYILAIISVPGMLLLLSDPLIAARTLIPIGALLSACMCFIIKSNFKICRYIVQGCGILVVFYFSLFSHSLGSYQERLQRGIEIFYPQIAGVLNSISSKGSSIYIVGEPDILQAPFYNAKYKNAILNISYQPLASGSPWGLVSMQQYGFNNEAEYKIYTDFSSVLSNAKSANKILEKKDLKLIVFKKNNDFFVCFSNVCGI